MGALCAFGGMVRPNLCEDRQGRARALRYGFFPHRLAADEQLNLQAWMPYCRGGDRKAEKAMTCLETD